MNGALSWLHVLRSLAFASRPQAPPGIASLPEVPGERLPPSRTVLGEWTGRAKRIASQKLKTNSKRHMAHAPELGAGQW
ncbi:hypothetical protein CJO81_25805 (plasmid) [Ralstonia solanacearum]|uniref:Uncharacterized protein n=1 Tax=Ralstonia solanacearum TaxID=305 RepID=A0AA86IWC0_RALSL|nr:hypothetical protein CJO74_24635 [Ralstonia solanacearum]AYA49561.1 hypothetical protein RSP824_24790 [Ralstonia pseudosolanacearum]AXV98889.1 hypothetical protein CJO80_25870 [Ralstonia solanacearum]AXW04077.1 hypothetical protein CJO81_25805 [Ralstonia solanacearum]AXW13349.1 hypothetical protein CJO83_23425 [Ralstonia solanacearum]